MVECMAARVVRPAVTSKRVAVPPDHAPARRVVMHEARAIRSAPDTGAAMVAADGGRDTKLSEMSHLACSDQGRGTIRFSCTDDRDRRIALCESGGIDDGDSELLLTGFRDPSEPPSPDGIRSREARFQYNHYARYQTEYLEIAVHHEGAEYRIYRHYDGAFGEPETTYGLTVTPVDGSLPVTAACVADVVDDLFGLASRLPCDSENALGCGFLESSDGPPD